MFMSSLQNKNEKIAYQSGLGQNYLKYFLKIEGHIKSESKTHYSQKSYN